MNAHILIGFTSGRKYKVVLDCADYAQVKKTFIATKQSDEFSKLEIWSRANGLEKSKRLRGRNSESKKETNSTEVEIAEESEDFDATASIPEVVETPVKKKRKGK